MNQNLIYELTKTATDIAPNEIFEAVDDMVKKLGQKLEDFRQSIYEEQFYPEELWDKIAGLGLFGALVPFEFGGSGLGLTACSIIKERLAYHGLASALAVVSIMNASVIISAGTKEQKDKWLPPFTEGKLPIAFALTEPDAGSNSLAIKTLASKTDGGYLLRGQKAWITGVDRARYILVVCRTTPYQALEQLGKPPYYGLTLLMVDTKSIGIQLQKMSTVGVEGYSQYVIYFEDVFVPEENRIGNENEGFKILFDALNPERILAASIALGMSEYALEKAATYAKERRVFGDTPIGAYQGVQHPLAELKILQEGARALTYLAANAYDKGLPSRLIGYYSNIAKYLASEVAFRSVDRCIQTHGGNGFVKEYGVIHLLAPARLLKTAPINNEMILNYVGEYALGLPRSY